ncbi:MAG TPA: protein kinase, partial [Candidatus Saccharimonadales bacterium]|nr:protein kinase [Candidatus Saccharimonadales bacterium]
YVDGITLRQHIDDNPPDLNTICDIGLQICNALEAAHSSGIIHRDIKPENIMLRKDGIVKVLDFGLAKLSQEDALPFPGSVSSEAETLAVTEPGTVFGTINYMSPEQARGLTLDHRTDLFSLGVVLYEMITGHIPFSGATGGDVLVAILDREPAPLLQVPVEVEAFVLRALAKGKEARYQTAGEMLSELRRLKKLMELDPDFSKITEMFGASGASAKQSFRSQPLELEQTVLTGSSGSSVDRYQTLGSKERTAAEIAHVLFMDIVEYTKKATHSQRQLIDYLNAIVRRTEDFRRAQADHRLICRATGDGMALVFFGDPESPVRCALQVSEVLKQQSEIKIRMGIHSGIVYRTINIAKEQDVTGRGISIAQRVMDCGDSAHILLSKEMVDVLEELGDWHDYLKDLGVMRVKHGTKVQIFNLCVGGLGNPEVPSRVVAARKEARRRAAKKSEAGAPAASTQESRRTSSAIDSLAILPLRNVSPDPSMEYLSDGITEAIINSLSQLPQIRVMARATVFRFKNKDVDPIAVGRELGVRAVMEGHVLQLGDMLIIRIELVNIGDGSQIWGEEYKRRLSDIFELQEEISKTISERLRFKLTGEEEQRLTRRYTENIEAYQLYLKGRYFWSQRTRDGLRKGSEFFRQAIDVDPTYALAYAGLADAYAFLGLHRVIPPHDIMPKAKAAAVKALQIDQTLAEGYSALAYIKTIYDWDWASAENDFKRSLELNQKDAPTHSYYANYLAAMGRHEEAMAKTYRAQELDPLSPIINVMVAYMAFLKRDYVLAMEQCRKTLEIEPRFFWIYMGFGWLYEEMGLFEQAIPQFEKAVELTGGTMGTLAGLGHA